MERISFLNDKFLAHDQCFIHIEDRGFQLADGIYEVILFKNNHLVDLDWHLDRLFRSLNAIEIKFHKTREELTEIVLELFKQNNLSSGYVYLQITRGVFPRYQAFPNQTIIPTIVANVSPNKIISALDLEKGFSAITYPDIRWGRCDIKSIGLLAGVLAKQQATAKNADEAILVRDHVITEGSFSNVFIVDKDDNLVTHPTDNNILCGITRNRIIDLAKKHSINVVEKKFSNPELTSAKEVFTSSSTLLIRPIVIVDGQKIADGKPGLVTKKLTDLYNNFVNQHSK